MQVCLVNMPYASMARPSIALGLIKGYLENANIETQIIDANLLYAHKAGVRYTYIVECINHENLCGEWTFAQAAFPEMDVDDDAYFALMPELNDNMKTLLRQHRAYAPRFVNQLADNILAEDPKIVGCTSTFQQNCASLALLRTIKAKRPDVITMMGGANCEGVMGDTLLRSFSWLDYVFSGECDDNIAAIIASLLEGKYPKPNEFNGLLVRDSSVITLAPNAKRAVPRAIVDDLSNITLPRYDDYFKTLTSLNLEHDIRPGLVLETSRGCWWGAKQHCTFCGLNGMGMNYRAKAADKVLDEMSQLAEQHQLDSFEIVDNIMAAEYLTSLAPELAHSDKDYEIFFETKANLKKHQVALMADAGIRWIQPGLESLNDDFLKLIKKGTTAVQNVATLKWCTQYGVRLFWNLLCNIPGEEDDWYQEMARWLPLIEHFQAPRQNLVKIRYPRFSPYFESPDTWGLKLKPLASYQHIYPLDDEALFDIAYFFENENDEGSYSLESSFDFDTPGHAAMQRTLSDWISRFWQQDPKPILHQNDDGLTIQIRDTRSIAVSTEHELTGLTAEIYRRCESPINHDRLLRGLAADYPLYEEEAFIEALRSLEESHLLLHLNSRYLALAIQGEAAELPPVERFPGGFLKVNENAGQLL